ncbi:hypothetical protein B0H13DRAFT_2297294 [Mycena leptocephala]|nr:hypothetical protein B0H13DRAFT_2297294 [Mycena leptocephala]
MTTRHDHGYEWVLESTAGCSTRDGVRITRKVAYALGTFSSVRMSHYIVLPVNRDWSCSSLHSNCNPALSPPNGALKPSVSHLPPLPFPYSSIACQIPRQDLVLPQAPKLPLDLLVMCPYVIDFWMQRSADMLVYMRAPLAAHNPPSKAVHADRGGHSQRITFPRFVHPRQCACARGGSESTSRVPVAFARSRIVGYCQCVTSLPSSLPLDVNADPTCARAQANKIYLDVLGASGSALRAAENLEGLDCRVIQD